MNTVSPPAATVAIGINEIRQAAGRIAPWAHRTPVMKSKALDARAGAAVFLKCENFQRVGAFKFRGAMNAVLQLSEAQRNAGVITHSSGNHAQAVALAGQLVGVPVTVVMPRNAPAVKRAATEGYGATIVTCEPTFRAREDTVAAQIERHGFTLVHPFDDWNVIAGQGTAALELLEEAGELDVVICPVGGGGLLAGTALAVAGASRATKIMAAEPANADDARRSLESGRIETCPNPATIADGLRTTSIGAKNFAVISRRVSQIMAVSEQEIIDAMKFVWERVKIVIEPSSAVAVAPLLTGKLAAGSRRIGVILSGGNVELADYFAALAAKKV
jgi:threonine dehydratase